MSNIIIEEGIFQTFPGVLIGVVSFRGIRNLGENSEVTDALRQEQSHVRERFAGITISEHPLIACWRDAYRKFGAKPKEHQSSIENLVRRLSKGQDLRHINLLVDIYNRISLRYLLPAGGEDLDAIRGDVRLTFASENEAPVKLLGEREERAPKPGEIIYKDDIGAICRRWNWKEADRTKLTEHTTRGLLVIESLPPAERSLHAQAVEDLAQSVQAYCGGAVSTTILDGSCSVVVLG